MQRDFKTVTVLLCYTFALNDRGVARSCIFWTFRAELHLNRCLGQCSKNFFDFVWFRQSRIWIEAANPPSQRRPKIEKPQTTHPHSKKAPKKDAPKMFWGFWKQNLSGLQFFEWLQFKQKIKFFKTKYLFFKSQLCIPVIVALVFHLKIIPKMFFWLFYRKKSKYGPQDCTSKSDDIWCAVFQFLF